MIQTTEKAMVISNATPVKQLGETQHYTTLISIRELAEIYNNLQYDGEAQRGTVDGKAQIDQKHVDSIYNSFINGHSIRGHLTWNIRKDKNEDYKLEEDALTLYKKAKVTLPDSAHRHAALKKIAENFKDDELLDSKFVLDIYNLDLEEEKELFSTINGKSKQPNKNRILYLSSDIKCQLLREVVQESDLKGKVETIRQAAHGLKLTKFSTLYDSLFSEKGYYNKEKVTNENYEGIKQWLIKFYNTLLSSREEFNYKTMEERRKYKNESILLEDVAWWGYAWLSKRLQHETNWKQTLKRKMKKKITIEGFGQKDFFSKENMIWHYTIIKPKYNFITKKQETGTKVTNSSTTRTELVKIMKLNLF